MASTHETQLGPAWPRGKQHFPNRHDVDGQKVLRFRVMVRAWKGYSRTSALLKTSTVEVQRRSNRSILEVQVPIANDGCECNLLKLEVTVKVREWVTAQQTIDVSAGRHGSNHSAEGTWKPPAVPAAGACHASNTGVLRRGLLLFELACFIPKKCPPPNCFSRSSQRLHRVGA